MPTLLFRRRRQFLKRTVVASGLALCGLSSDVLGSQKKRQRRKKKGRRKNRKQRLTEVLNLSEDHFEELVGQAFKVSGGPRPVMIKLVEVREHDHQTDDVQRPIHIRQEPFSLLFVASGGEKLKSGIHEVEHPELGEFDLFIHEVGAAQDKETTFYEVVFN